MSHPNVTPQNPTCHTDLSAPESFVEELLSLGLSPSIANSPEEILAALTTSVVDMIQGGCPYADTLARRTALLLTILFRRLNIVRTPGGQLFQGASSVNTGAGSQISVKQLFDNFLHNMTCIPSVKSPSEYSVQLVPPTTSGQHCVRCHQNFTSNEPGDCEVPHVFYPDPANWNSKYEQSYHPACCQSSIRAVVVNEDGDDPNPEDFEFKNDSLCFLGSHTTKDGEVGFNDANVFRCVIDEKGECKRPWLERRNGPIWIGSAKSVPQIRV
ncbi:hypothetical protein BV22DRAFT_1127252 [Leucogyrophana mollusca]|uniref:Uncharacterized protein n=1 Tax=Leucogyrophana mollusca TaxID=85980 RepID=A0ACB8BS14_9AGAM|nr:hypothetical protein BV22DRAFT_1127252 [Leucogyrophana mollusca]